MTGVELRGAQGRRSLFLLGFQILDLLEGIDLGREQLPGAGHISSGLVPVGPRLGHEGIDFIQLEAGQHLAFANRLPGPHEDLAHHSARFEGKLGFGLTTENPGGLNRYRLGRIFDGHGTDRNGNAGHHTCRAWCP